jgi:hypothetical protein
MDNSLSTTIANSVWQFTTNCSNYAMSFSSFGGDGRRMTKGSGADILSIECRLDRDLIRRQELQTAKLQD